MKVITVLGARPQFIKASVVSHAIQQAEGVKEIVVHTGQHFDANMSDVFFTDLGMNKPDYSLGVHGGSHAVMTARMLVAVEDVIMKEQPNIVLVYGDTNSTLAGALAAAKMHIPVAHVEAGLRSFNMAMPEEVNRVLTDRISNWLFTPTKTATANLLQEGFSKAQITEVGDVMLDVALHHGDRVQPGVGLMAELNLKESQYILATIHRQENTDDTKRLKNIVKGLINIAKKTPVVWPLHPRTKSVLKEIGLLNELERKVILIDPVGYLEMVQLEKYSSLIVTDSGGVQKEAFFHQVPCVTVREETEWVELVKAGWNRLAPPLSTDVIITAIEDALESKGDVIKPYGNGQAAKNIVSALLKER